MNEGSSVELYLIGVKIIEIDHDEKFSGVCNTAGSIPVYNIDEINAVVFMFKRHLKGIMRALVTDANCKAERTNGSIQEIKTIGRGYGNAERYRIAILFFYGGLDIS